MATAVAGSPLVGVDAAQSSGPVHPHYVQHAADWRKLAHAYDGAGGFRDGGYLIPHPLEWADATSPIYPESDPLGANGTPPIRYAINPNPTQETQQLRARRALARYENIAAPIIDAKVGALFREEVIRRAGEDGKQPHEYLEWTEDVDGEGTCLDDFLKKGWQLAGIFGFSIVTMDKPTNMPKPATKADEQAPFLRLYTPLDMPDWLTNERGTLTAVRLLEAVPRTSLDEAAILGQYQSRILTETMYRVDVNGTKGTEADNGIGALPVVLLYAKEKAMTPVIGSSVLHSPQLYIDLYNLTSELRQLLRDQTFGILNVVIGTGPDAPKLQEVQAMMGQAVGTGNVLFTPSASSFIQPDTANVAAYQKERADLIRAIYRMCAIPFEADSKDAEAEGSLKLKREDMNQVLAAYADELEAAEWQIAELWAKAMGRGDEALEGLEIHWPDTFDVTPFDGLLEQAQALIALDYPREVVRQIQKQLLAKFLPSLPETERKKLEAAIDAFDPDAEREKAMRERLLEGSAVLQPGVEEDTQDPDKPKPAQVAA